jgi:hypothetical protein
VITIVLRSRKVYLQNFVASFFRLIFHKFKPSALTEDHPVSSKCLYCICHAMTGCVQKTKCKGACGQYKLSWGYWADSGKPTLPGESPESETAFSNCALDSHCSSESVQGYMSNFEQVLNLCVGHP